MLLHDWVHLDYWVTISAVGPRSCVTRGYKAYGFIFSGVTFFQDNLKQPIHIWIRIEVWQCRQFTIEHAVVCLFIKRTRRARRINSPLHIWLSLSTNSRPEIFCQLDALRNSLDPDLTDSECHHKRRTPVAHHQPISRIPMALPLLVRRTRPS